jgi:predicted kinase
MKLNEITNQQIILVCGHLCSGKGHFCQANYPNFTRIEVSNVVRSVSKATDRLELSKTAQFDTAIIQRLYTLIDQHDKVIVDGIRQPSILHALEKHYGDRIIDIIWLDVPEDTRRKRYEDRASEKDKRQTFDQAIKGDIDLGINDIENYIRTKHKVIPY